MDNPGRGQGKGQDKEHEITNTETGEKRTITQREWREQGQQLRADGWARAEDEAEEGDVEAEEGEPEGGAGQDV
jgi:hypothetical protein